MGFLEKMFGNKQNDQALAQEYFDKGAQYAQQQQWPQAIEALKEAVRLNPKHAKAHMALCMSYGGAMDLESARKHFDILKKLDPELANRVANSPAGMMILRGGTFINF